MSSLGNTRTWVRRGSLAAGIAYTATAEYELAIVLGASWPVAIMLPVAIDCYLIAALKWFRAFDIALSLALMGAAQVSAHALDAGVITVTLELVTVVSLLVPVAIWRTHALARQTPRPIEDAKGVHTVETPSPAAAAVEPVTLERPEQQDAPGTPALPPVPPQDTEDTDTSWPVLLTSRDVAERCGVDPSTVRSWVASGRLAVHSKDARGHNLFDPAGLLAAVTR